MAKRRLDALIVDRGLARGREKAQALVMAGQVRVHGHAVPKAGTLVDEDTPLEVSETARYVSRGGEKLDHALEVFGLDVSGLVAADIGASTGGFTDCLLQRGAIRVYAVDAGKGQLDYSLRKDERIVVMEGVNARNLDSLPESIGLATIDVSFISLRAVLPAVRGLFEGTRRGEMPFAPTRASGSVVALFKPQFEARKDEVPRGGVIRNPQLHATLIGRFTAWCVANRLRVLDMTTSPILGAEGNREFLFWLRADPSPAGPLRRDSGRDLSRARERARSGRERSCRNGDRA